VRGAFIGRAVKDAARGSTFRKMGRVMGGRDGVEGRRIRVVSSGRIGGAGCGDAGDRTGEAKAACCDQRVPRRIQLRSSKPHCRGSATTELEGFA
jgi:hypothetical protein